MAECEEYTTPETVYLGHDNAVSIVPYANYVERVKYDMTDVTLVTASADLTTSVGTGDDIAVDSDDDPVVVWWSQVFGEWQIHLKVGLFAAITPESYKLRVVIIDPSYPNGLVIADDLLVDVVDIP